MLHRARARSLGSLEIRAGLLSAVAEGVGGERHTALLYTHSEAALETHNKDQLKAVMHVASALPGG
jgi:hypothetical protein